MVRRFSSGCSNTSFPKEEKEDIIYINIIVLCIIYYTKQYFYALQVKHTSSLSS